MSVKFSKVLFFLMMILLSPLAFSEPFVGDTDYQACFTPGQECTKLIVDVLNAAKSSIYVQAFSFTSRPIGKALVAAKKRGVDVVVIFDKSEITNYRGSASRYFMKHNIPVYIDYKLAIAHNKVMIIDKKIIVMGSFNFTRAAQYNNAENLLIISNKALALKYLNNWNSRLKQSVNAQEFLHKNETTSWDRRYD